MTGLTHEQQVTRWLKGCRTAREEGLAKKCFLQPYETAQKALGAAFAQLGADAKVIAMPCGGSTLPCIQ